MSHHHIPPRAPVIIIATFVGLLVLMLPPIASFGSTHAPTGPTSEVFLPLIAKPSFLAPPPPGDWLAYVNYYRATANLPPVSEESDFSAGDRLHARYMVKNDVIEHTEDSTNPWYTQEGYNAARSSNLAASYEVDKTDEWAIDAWMTAPFHAVGVLDPGLRQVGYGAYREADGGFQMGAALDVIRGLTYPPPSSIMFPIRWPANGISVPIGQHWGETPDPLTSCPGYSRPAGLPVILQLGPGNITPAVTAHSFFQGTTPLDHCVFDETSYLNPDAKQQELARDVLGSRDAIVLIPRAPLTAGTSYTVSITTNGWTYSWTFSIRATNEPPAQTMEGIVR